LKDLMAYGYFKGTMNTNEIDLCRVMNMLWMLLAGEGNGCTTTRTGLLIIVIGHG